MTKYEQLLNELVNTGYSGMSCIDMEDEMDRILDEYGIKKILQGVTTDADGD